MANYKFRMTKNGLLTLKWEPDSRSDYRREKKDGKYLLRHKKTQEVVRTSDELDDLEEFFWQPTESPSLFSVLHEQVDFDKDVTANDLIRIINADEVASAFLKELFVIDEFPDWEESFDLTRVGFVEGDNLTFQYKSCGGFDGPIVIDNELSLSRDGEVIVRAEHRMTLLDVFRCLFVPWQEFPSTLYFKPEGLTFPNGEVIQHPVKWLFNPVEVIDCTLLNVLDYVEKHPVLMAFFSCYSGGHFDLKLFHDDTRAPHETVPDETKFIRSEVSCDLHLSQYKDEFYWCEGMDFHSYGEMSEQSRELYKDGEVPQYERYGIGWNGCSYIANLPIVINEDVRIYHDSRVVKENGENKLIHPVDVIQVRYRPSVLEFLHAIYFEMTFHGPPEKAAAFGADMRERVEEIEEAKAKIEAGEAEEWDHFHSMEDIWADLRESAKDDYDAETLDEAYPLSADED